MRFLALSGLALLVALSLACSRTPEPPPPDKPVEMNPSSPPPTVTGAATQPAASAKPAAGPSEVAWEAPSAWTSAPNPSPMRKATYKIPKAAGDAEDAELTVTSAGGGVQPNVERWAKQFGGATPKTETKKVNGLDVTIVELEGTYSSGGMMGPAGPPKEKQRLLGAIVEGGEVLHFFKMVGPDKTVTAARKDFDALVSSLRAK